MMVATGKQVSVRGEVPDLLAVAADPPLCGGGVGAHGHTVQVDVTEACADA